MKFDISLFFFIRLSCCCLLEVLSLKILEFLKKKTLTKMGKSKKQNNKEKPTPEEKPAKVLNNNAKENPKKKKQKAKKVKDAIKEGLVKPPIPAAELKAKQRAGKNSPKPAKSTPVTKPQQSDKTPEKSTPAETKKAKRQQNKLNRKLQNEANKSEIIKTGVSPGQTIFVGNVPSNTKHVQLTRLFSPFGKVLSVRFRTANGKVIYKHKMRKDSAALTAYVVLDSVDAATKALELNGTVLKEHVLRVQKSEKNEQNSSPKNTIFVGNLKSSTTDDSLHQIFSSCGEIDYVRTLYSADKGAGCNGTAFVCFKSPEAVGLALELEGTMLEERPIHVERYSTNKLGAKEKRIAESKSSPNQKKNKKGGLKVKGGKPLEKAALEFRNKGKKFTPKKGQGDKSEDKKNIEKKKKSEFRGVKVDGIKKKPKKKIPSQMKRLANKIAPKE